MSESGFQIQSLILVRIPKMFLGSDLWPSRCYKHVSIFVCENAGGYDVHMIFILYSVAY